MKTTALASLGAIALADLTHVVELLKVIALLVPIVVGAIQALRRPPRREPKPRRKPPTGATLLVTAALVGAFALCAGCKLIDVPRTVQALGSDTNVVTVHVQSAFGSVDVRRNAPEH